MANKQMANLSSMNRYYKETSASYKKAFESLLEAVGSFAKDNPKMDLLPLGQISTDIAARLTHELQKAEYYRDGNRSFQREQRKLNSVPVKRPTD